MPRARKLEIPCPSCGSAAVFYSCTPACCFNHVCEDCTGTFQPVTNLTGSTATRPLPPNPLPDSTQTTVACAKCQSTAVYRAPDSDALVCTDCGALLALELTEIAAG